MTTRRVIRVVLFMTLVMAIVACNGDNDDKDAEIVLSESVSMNVEGGQLTVHYPDGWANDLAGGGGTFSQVVIRLATNLSLLENQSAFQSVVLDEVLKPGTVFVSVYILNDDEQQIIVPEDLIAWHLEILADSDGAVLNASEVEVYQVNGRAVAMAYGTLSDYRGTQGRILTAIKVGSVPVWLTFAVPPDEVDDRVPLARAITAQIEFTPDE